MTLGRLRPGTVLSRPFWGGTHYGLVSDLVDDRGTPLILHNSGLLGRAVETTLEDFANGKEGLLLVEGYLSNLPEHVVLERARSMLGRPFSLFSWNCEDYITEVHGLGLRGTSQVAAVGALIFVLAAGAVVLVLLRRRRRRRGRS